MTSSIMTSSKNTTNTFATEIIKTFSIEKVLYLNLSTFGVFQDISQHCSVEIKRFDEKPTEKGFGLIVADLPLGLHRLQWESNDKKIKLHFQKNWIEIIKFLAHLRDEGLGLFLIEPSVISTRRGEEFRQELGKYGFYVKAVLNTPEKILEPETSFRPIILLISKELTEKWFIAELSDADQAKVVIHNFFNGLTTDNLLTGVIVDKSEFKSFHHFKSSKQIGALRTQYKEYKQYELSEVMAEVNSVRSGESFYERENTIYIPRLGKSRVIATLDDAKLKHHNYFQVVLDSTLVKSEYAAQFFSSALGQLMLDSLSTSTLIPHVNKSDLLNLTIAIPEVKEQEMIIGTHRKLSQLKSAVDAFEKELALNPTSSQAIHDQLDQTLDSLGKLTASDKVLALIRAGETKTTEFKQTLSLDVKKQTKENYIEVAVLKTVAAFLNSDGGTLLVGVADNGEVFGIDNEIRKLHKGSRDIFLLHFKNLIRRSIGEGFYPLIEYRLVTINSKTVLVVECKCSQEPCWFEEHDFYVRTNPATDKLEGPKLLQYIKQHFG